MSSTLTRQYLTSFNIKMLKRVLDTTGLFDVDSLWHREKGRCGEISHQARSISSSKSGISFSGAPTVRPIGHIQLVLLAFGLRQRHGYLDLPKLR
ncbi:hypothetical protein HJB77_22850 [Rhizobium lentis]|uniref:hypothetical protein n=1 Tax=Rhizobium lentis TaxID=1138194 RepID=UPI001C82F6C3|nr:hypothetical protein [Rhizobium lentis]MBX5179082.1 hypothetical protein [Rhizobium lentis]